MCFVCKVFICVSGLEKGDHVLGRETVTGSVRSAVVTDLGVANVTTERGVVNVIVAESTRTDTATVEVTAEKVTGRGIVRGNTGVVVIRKLVLFHLSCS